ncbi:MAG: glycerophosphodiester phosphodiesterase [Planctomycetaceae bacterium]|nr:glycerophosphodiester phosphodiesterase [Planctomycetaceae bacterium]
MLQFIRVLLFVVTIVQALPAASPIVIAHRGASGYLPEHTLAAVAMAHAMNADFIEQDLVLTKDLHPIVLHDIHLDTVSDVRTKFPDRARNDGRFYAIDFTLAEIKTLRIGERIDHRTGRPAFPNRFPTENKPFTIPTFEEELQIIHGLNQTRHRTIGVYPEIKYPKWHRDQGKDISPIVLNSLARFGYTDANAPVYLQCFEQAELMRIRNELGCKLKIVQLMGKDKPGEQTYSKMLTDEGLHRVASYAQGIGPELKQVISGRRTDGKPQITSLVADAHRHQLLVHPYTFRVDQLPDYVDDWPTLIDWFVEAQIDGLFTDFPDRVRVIVGPSQ